MEDPEKRNLLSFCQVLIKHMSVQNAQCVGKDMKTLESAEMKSDLSKIYSLDLSNLGLTELPLQLALLTGLEELNIAGNSLSGLPEWFAFPHLSVLDHDDSLPIPPAVQETLDLNKSREEAELSKLCPFLELKGDEEAKAIAAESKSLQFPEKRRKLASIRNLDLSNKSLATFPEEVLLMKKLQELNLSENLLQDLPDRLRDLRHLETLDLRCNLFATLPAVINDMKARVLFQGNPLCSGSVKRDRLSYLGLPSTALITIHERDDLASIPKKARKDLTANEKTAVV